MFSNIGKKIKTLATVIVWIGIICSVVIAFAVSVETTFVIGILYFIIGCLFSWISNFFVYAFGEIVDNCEQQTAILNQLRDKQDKMNENLAQLQNKMNS